MYLALFPLAVLLPGNFSAAGPAVSHISAAASR
jgi:hypothetical protein